jgi:hypothetical protein
MTRIHPTADHASREDAAQRALSLQAHVRATLDGPDLLRAAAEDCCTWFGYLSVALCHIERPDAPLPSEDAPTGR